MASSRRPLKVKSLKIVSPKHSLNSTQQNHQTVSLEKKYFIFNTLSSLNSQMSLLFLLFLSFQLSAAVPRHLLLQTAAATSSCPLDFTLLQKFSKQPLLDLTSRCHYVSQGIRLAQSEYLRTTGNFLPPISTAESCWVSYQTQLSKFAPTFDLRKTCGFQTNWISQGCMNITTRQEFESEIPTLSLNNVVHACNQSLLDGSPCASCTMTLSSLQASYLTGDSVGNLSTCIDYPSIYAAAVVNSFGPADKGTAKCLLGFNSDDNSTNSERRERIVIICVVVIGCTLFLVLGSYGFWLLKKKQRRRQRRVDRIGSIETSLGFELDSIKESTTLIRFSFDEIRQATKNFARDNIVGRGGYGNVFKGVLPDGSEVAFKRFKNCSVAGDAVFCHEVEVIASVRHVNLVGLRGYCTATTPLEGHQRIIVCDLMKNGSLHDHLFGLRDDKLSWPIRQKIALGTARGLAYLHYGAQPCIIHRDIKASNILLDEKFEPKLADFGLAKFNPEGMTHLSTRVAGTMGYVAPEYALYGQLTERSDVYSFGVVLLELLSGKKAIMAVNEGQTSNVTEWAWNLVRKGRALDVIEDGMPDLGAPEVVEKYVLVAVLCSHPQLYARPTMDQVVKILDVDMEMAVPSIPVRPIPLNADMDDIERSVSSSGSGNLSTSAGYQPYTAKNEHPSKHKEEGEISLVL